jgi:NADH-quinone oxidoreductase subunit M
MASIGLPGLNGFVGEMLSLAGMFARHKVYAVLGATGVVLGAWYLLNMLQHAFFGPLREPHAGESLRSKIHRGEDSHADASHSISDMNAREFFAIAPIAALCLWIGVMPQPLLNLIRPDVDAVVSLYAPADAQQASQAMPLNFAVTSGVNPHTPTLNPEP